MSASFSKSAIPFSILNRHSQEINGIYQSNSANEFVVFCHGLCGSKDSIFFSELSELLEQDTIRFDFPLYTANDTFRYGDFEEDIQDLWEVVDHFQRSTGKKCAGLIGHSRGANIVLEFGLMYKFPPKIVNLCARFDMKGAFYKHPKEAVDNALNNGVPFKWTTKCRNAQNQLLTTTFELRREDLEKYFLHQKIIDSYINYSSNISIMTIHGEKDRNIPVEDAYEFARIFSLVTLHKLLIIPKTDHFFRNQHQFVMQEIKAFFS